MANNLSGYALSSHLRIDPKVADFRDTSGAKGFVIGLPDQRAVPQRPYSLLGDGDQPTTRVLVTPIRFPKVWRSVPAIPSIDLSQPLAVTGAQGVKIDLHVDGPSPTEANS